MQDLKVQVYRPQAVEQTGLTACLGHGGQVGDPQGLACNVFSHGVLAAWF